METDEKRGQRIRELREARFLSQEDVGRGLGIHGRTVYGWERGWNISPRNQRKLAEFFGTTTDYIAEGKGSPPTTATRPLLLPVPPPPDTSGGGGELHTLDRRLAHVEQQLDQLLGLIGANDSSAADLKDAIVKTLEKALLQRAREVGRRPRARPNPPGRLAEAGQ